MKPVVTAKDIPLLQAHAALPAVDDMLARFESYYGESVVGAPSAAPPSLPPREAAEEPPEVAEEPDEVLADAGDQADATELEAPAQSDEEVAAAEEAEQPKRKGRKSRKAKKKKS